MKFESLFFLSPVLLVAVLLYFTPLLTRRGIFFSATVNADFPKSGHGLRLMRAYRQQVVLWTAVAAVLVLSITPLHPNWSPVAPLALLIVGVGFSYWRKFHEVHARFGVGRVDTGKVSPHLSHMKGNLKLWIILPPFLALAAVAAYLQWHWNSLPQRFPVHWGIDGQPDEWASRNWHGIYGMVLFGASLEGLLLALAWIFLRFTRKTVMHYVTVRSFQFLLYPMALSFVLMSLRPIVSTPAWVIPALVLASIAALVYWSYLEISAPSEVNEIKNDAHWKAGIFYWNPNDPVLFVPKRVGIGYTLNFANEWSWMVIIAIVAAILIPLFLLPH